VALRQCGNEAAKLSGGRWNIAGYCDSVALKQCGNDAVGQRGRHWDIAWYYASMALKPCGKRRRNNEGSIGTAVGSGTKWLVESAVFGWA
jgi:hypothetical protein